MSVRRLISTASALCATATALPVVRRELHPWQIAAEGIGDLLAVPAAFLAGVATLRGQRPTAVVAAAAVVAALRWRLEVRPRRTPPYEPKFRLVAANLLASNDRVGRLADEISGDDPDVVVLVELTPEHAAAIADSRLSSRCPHQVVDPQEGYYGSAILSRLPIVSSGVVLVGGTPMAYADVVSRRGQVVHVVAVHTLAPSVPERVKGWDEQHDELGVHVDRCADHVVLAGDFNATVRHRPFRRLLRHGLTDALSLDGRPHRTWPNGPRSIPVMRLDHVLVTRRVGVRSARTAPSAGGDHRRVICDLACA